MCKPDKLNSLAVKNQKLMKLIFMHERAIFAHVQQSAACNAAHYIDARLSRWLLRARELAQSDTLHFTHDYLSTMLGVLRSTVSPAAKNLQVAGLIKYTRGKIQITDVDGLKGCACDCYASLKKRRDLLTGL